jgi:hypothetical protein
MKEWLGKEPLETGLVSSMEKRIGVGARRPEISNKSIMAPEARGIYDTNRVRLVCRDEDPIRRNGINKSQVVATSIVGNCLWCYQTVTIYDLATVNISQLPDVLSQNLLAAFNSSGKIATGGLMYLSIVRHFPFQVVQLSGKAKDSGCKDQKKERERNHNISPPESIDDYPERSVQAVDAQQEEEGIDRCRVPEEDVSIAGSQSRQVSECEQAKESEKSISLESSEDPA